MHNLWQSYFCSLRLPSPSAAHPLSPHKSCWEAAARSEKFVYLSIAIHKERNYFKFRILHPQHMAKICNFNHFNRIELGTVKIKAYRSGRGLVMGNGQWFSSIFSSPSLYCLLCKTNRRLLCLGIQFSLLLLLSIVWTICTCTMSTTQNGNYKRTNKFLLSARNKIKCWIAMKCWVHLSTFFS